MSVIFEPPRNTCRDCGADVPEASLEGAETDMGVSPVPDTDDAYVLALRKPGACPACGGGRVIVCIRFAPDELGLLRSKELGSGSYPSVHLSAYTLEREALDLVSRLVCERRVVIPVALAGSTLVIAMADPLDEVARSELRALTGRRIEPVRASTEDIVRNIERYYGVERDG